MEYFVLKHKRSDLPWLWSIRLIIIRIESLLFKIVNLIEVLFFLHAQKTPSLIDSSSFIFILRKISVYDTYTVRSLYIATDISEHYTVCRYKVWGKGMHHYLRGDRAIIGLSKYLMFYYRCVLVQVRSPSKWYGTTTPGVGEVTATPVTENSSSAGVTATIASLFAWTNQMGKDSVVCNTIFVININIYNYLQMFIW